MVPEELAVVPEELAVVLPELVDVAPELPLPDELPAASPPDDDPPPVPPSGDVVLEPPVHATGKNDAATMSEGKNPQGALIRPN